MFEVGRSGVRNVLIFSQDTAVQNQELLAFFASYRRERFLYCTILASFGDAEMVEASESLLRKLCHEPTVFLADAYNEKLRESLKALFDGAVASEPSSVKPLGPLSALEVGQEVDLETIWQELQLRDGPLIRWARGSTEILLSMYKALHKYNY